jgi:hypothetical protein
MTGTYITLCFDAYSMIKCFFSTNFVQRISGLHSNFVVIYISPTKVNAGIRGLLHDFFAIFSIASR